MYYFDIMPVKTNIVLEDIPILSLWLTLQQQAMKEFLDLWEPERPLKVGRSASSASAPVC